MTYILPNIYSGENPQKLRLLCRLGYSDQSVAQKMLDNSIKNRYTSLKFKGKFFFAAHGVDITS